MQTREEEMEMVMPLVLLLNLCKLQCLISKWGDTAPPLLVGGLRGNPSKAPETGLVHPVGRDGEEGR